MCMARGSALVAGTARVMIVPLPRRAVQGSFGPARTIRTGKRSRRTRPSRKRRKWKVICQFRRFRYVRASWVGAFGAETARCFRAVYRVAGGSGRSGRSGRYSAGGSSVISRSPRVSSNTVRSSSASSGVWAIPRRSNILFWMRIAWSTGHSVIWPKARA